MTKYNTFTLFKVNMTEGMIRRLITQIAIDLRDLFSKLHQKETRLHIGYSMSPNHMNSVFIMREDERPFTRLQKQVLEAYQRGAYVGLSFMCNVPLIEFHANTEV